MQNGARRRRSLPFQLLVAILTVMAATALTIAVKEFAPQFTYGIYYAAVVIAAFYVGIEAGIVTAIISGPVGNYLFVEPAGRLLTTPAELLHMITFWAICGVICALIYVSRRNEDRLRARALY